MRMVEARWDTSTTVLPARCSCSDFKIARRLVQKHQRRIVQEGAGQAQPLALAA